MEKKYLIIALRYWRGHEHVLFWGENRSGYYTDLTKAGLYTKEEAKKICLGIHNEDCYISIDTLGITPEIMKPINDNVRVVVPKSDKICDYAHTWGKINKNIRFLKYGY